MGDQSYIMDTPGFSSIYLDSIKEEEVKELMPEFLAYESQCRFQGCMHLGEPECGVKSAVSCQKIHAGRYLNYQKIIEEKKNSKSRRRYF